jgi:hypothetical protein
LVIPKTYKGLPVTSIGYLAFSDCWHFTRIIIPDSVTLVGGFAFAGCSGLDNITFEGTVAQWNAIIKEIRWNTYTGDYTIYCIDGTMDKSGNIVG